MSARSARASGSKSTANSSRGASATSTAAVDARDASRHRVARKSATRCLRPGSGRGRMVTVIASSGDGFRTKRTTS